MQVVQSGGIFNNQDSGNLKNKTLFSNMLNNIESLTYDKEIDVQKQERKDLVSEYNKLIKNPLATYMEVNSNAILSMRNSMQNQVVPIDIKRVNATSAYSA